MAFAKNQRGVKVSPEDRHRLRTCELLKDAGFVPADNAAAATAQAGGRNMRIVGNSQTNFVARGQPTQDRCCCGQWMKCDSRDR
jgi:hypothetical protein